MDMAITIQVPRAAFLQAAEGQAILRQEVARGMMRITERIATRAKEHAPVDRGILRSAIFASVESGHGTAFVQGMVAVGRQAPYAEDVERGTPPHWVRDIDALKGWARRKFANQRLAYAVRQSIARRGTKAQPFMEPAFREVSPHIAGILNAAVAIAVRRLS